MKLTVADLKHLITCVEDFTGPFNKNSLGFAVMVDGILAGGQEELNRKMDQIHNSIEREKKYVQRTKVELLSKLYTLEEELSKCKSELSVDKNGNLQLTDLQINKSTDGKEGEQK